MSTEKTYKHHMQVQEASSIPNGVLPSQKHTEDGSDGENLLGNGDVKHDAAEEAIEEPQDR